MGFTSQGPGLGSSFYFELPLHSSATAGIEPNSLTQLRPPVTSSTNSVNNLYSSRYSPSNRYKQKLPTLPTTPSNFMNFTAVEESTPSVNSYFNPTTKSPRGSPLLLPSIDSDNIVHVVDLEGGDVTKAALERVHCFGSSC